MQYSLLSNTRVELFYTWNINSHMITNFKLLQIRLYIVGLSNEYSLLPLWSSHNFEVNFANN